MTTIQIAAGVAGTVLAAVLPEVWRSSSARWKLRRRRRSHGCIVHFVAGGCNCGRCCGKECPWAQ